MTTSQIAAYKKLLNNRALNEYKIKHTPLSKDEKRAKISEIEVDFVKRVENTMSPNSYQIWIANRVYEQGKRKF